MTGTRGGGRRGRPAERDTSRGASRGGTSGGGASRGGTPAGGTSVLVRIGEIGVLVLVLTPIIMALLGVALVLVVLGFSMLGG